ncbi:MAG: DUF547 domain-containing protein [Saprospiraceae bacterium]|nr:DUF547 domain-containing protein [Saprospiraceae bacterium]
MLFRIIITTILFSFLVPSYCQVLDSFFVKADEFYFKNVLNNKIRYKHIKENPELLNKLIEFIASAKIDSLSPTQLKAFYINAYNLLVIKNVIDHYPLNSPLDVAGFFDGIRHQIAGKKTTLNNFEKKELLQQFNDPRLHFVLVCGALGCPPIANYVYRPENLEKQLMDRTSAAINNPNFIYPDVNSNKIYISKIFDWYRSDFKPDVKTFINEYKKEGIPKDIHLSYYNYDWKLNDVTMNVDTLTKINSSSVFAPIIVAATMPKHTFEVNLFNSIFTANYQYNNSRSTYFTGLFQFSYGLTGDFDIGVDFLLKSYRANDLYNSSPFRVLEFKRATELVRTNDSLYVTSDFGLSHVGPRIRWAPFRKVSITLEQGLFFPIPTIPSGNNFDKAYYWVTQLYFNHEFNNKFGAFVALTFWQPIVPNEKFKFQVPYLKLFFSWYTTKRFSLYATTTSFTEWGVGARYLITPQFEIQALYTYYIPIPELTDLYVGNALNVMTFNLGIRYRINTNR